MIFKFCFAYYTATNHKKKANRYSSIDIVF